MSVEPDMGVVREMIFDGYRVEDIAHSLDVESAAIQRELARIILDAPGATQNDEAISAARLKRYGKPSPRECARCGRPSRVLVKSSGLCLRKGCGWVRYRWSEISSVGDYDPPTREGCIREIEKIVNGSKP